MAASNFAPLGGQIRVIAGENTIEKVDISTRQRLWMPGTAMWLNKVSGHYIAEPALLNTVNATVDVGFGGTASAASTYATKADADAAFAPLFLGFAASARLPQQCMPVGNFNQPGPAGTVPLYADDASRPFIGIYTRGIALCPIGKELLTSGVTTASLEVGILMGLSGFVNEAASGFYDPSGTGSGAGGYLQLDTKYYLYGNAVTTAVAAGAIGTVYERAPIGSTHVKIEFVAKATLGLARGA